MQLQQNMQKHTYTCIQVFILLRGLTKRHTFSADPKKDLARKMYRFPEEPIKVLARKNVLTCLVQGTKNVPPPSEVSQHTNYPTCAVEHMYMLQEQCSLLRTCLKLTETCIPRTLKTAVQPDFPRTRKRSSQEKRPRSLVQGMKMSAQVRSHKHMHTHRQISNLNDH